MFKFFSSQKKMKACEELDLIYNSLKSIYDFSTIPADRKEYLADLISRYGYLPYPFRKAQEELTPNEVLFGLEIKWVNNKVFDGKHFRFPDNKQSVLARKNIKNANWIKKEGHNIKLINLAALGNGNKSSETGKFMDWLMQLLILPTGNLENGIFNTTIYLIPFHPREFGCAYLPRSSEVSEKLLDEDIKKVTGMGVKKQVQTFIALAQLAGHPVIYDILPQTGRFSKAVLSNPHIARWFDIKELNKQITDNIESLLKTALKDADEDDIEVIKNVYMQSQSECMGTLSEKYKELFAQFSEKMDEFKKEISNEMLKNANQKKLHKRVKDIVAEIEGSKKIQTESDITKHLDIIQKLIAEELWPAPGGAWCSAGVPVYDTMSDCGGYPMFKHYNFKGEDVTHFANLDCQTPYYFVNLENGTYNQKVVEFFINEMKKLQSDYNFDGFRVDHIDHIVDEVSEKNGTPISYRAPRAVLGKLNKTMKEKIPYFGTLAEYMLWDDFLKEYHEDMSFDTLWGNDIVMQNEKTPEKIIEDNQHLTNYNVARKNKNYLSILKTYNNQDGEFRCIDQYPGQLGDEGAIFKWFKYKFLPGGKFAQRAVLYVDGDESFTKRGIEKVIGEEVAMERALDYPFYNKFDAIDRFVKNNAIITDGEAQIIDQDEDGFASWIISKEPLKDGFLIVANYKAPTEKIEGEIVEGKPVQDKKVLLPSDYSITGEYKFNGTDFVKEKYNGGSELHFDELANGEFKIYSTRKV
ncbi:MAG: hypothetical protein NC390_06675 [Fusobacterium sp.]|nr:hypothetical protein [Fusobacterium sp.]